MRCPTNVPKFWTDFFLSTKQLTRAACVSCGAEFPAVLGLALLSSAVAPVAAQTTIDWNNAAGGAYEDTSNWNPMELPDNIPGPENARFALPAAYDVAFNSGGDITVNDLLVEDGSVTFASDGLTSASYTINDDALIQSSVLTLAQAGGSGDMALAIQGDLDVRDFGTLSVMSGSEVDVAGLMSIGTDLGLGVVLVSGNSSRLNVTGTGKHAVGAMGQTGTLTFDDHSTGNSIDGSLLLSGGTSVSRSTLAVFDGADLTLGNLSIGVGTQSESWTSVQVGEFPILDPPSVTQTGASTLTIGTTGDGFNSLNVEWGGTFTTGTEQITVNANGRIRVAEGTFNANADVMVDGGEIIVTTTPNFNLGVGRVVTAQNGGEVTINNDYQFDDGTLFEIIDGAFLDSFGDPDWHVGNATDGTVIVDGSSGPSRLRLRGGDLTIGSGAGAGVVIIREGATAVMEIGSLGQIGGLSVGSDSNGTGVLTVTVGGDFDVGPGSVTINKTGLVDINGGTFNVGGDIIIDGGELRRGAGSFDLADGQTMTISGGGLVDFTGETLTLPANATVNVNNGAVVTSQISVDPTATFAFNQGTLRDTNELTLSPNDGLAGVRQLTFGKTLIVEDETALNGVVLVIDGGTFSTGSLASPALLDFRRGTFELTGDDLTIGGGGLLGAAVALPLGKNVNVTNSVNLAADGLVSLQGGQLSGFTINNAGHIDMATATSMLNGGKVNNTGLISGDGKITALLNNQSGGEVRVTTGEQLRLTAVGNSNDGIISLFGGTVEFTQDLTNDVAGAIAGQGALVVGGGLTNNGTVSFGGTTNVDGDVANNPTGAITASGGGTTNFLGDLVNNGELAIGTSSFATVFGTLSGSGSITGEGTLIVEGQFNPGSSPAAVEIATDFQLGAGAVVRIELGGLSPGAQYDQVHVAGRAELDGELTVEAIDGFRPRIGDEFEIMTYASSSGTFDRVTAAPGYAWELAYGERALVIRATAVPEPATWLLAVIGIAIGGVVVRKRHGRV